MNDKTEQPLSGQQLQEIMKRANTALQEAVSKMELRQLAVRLAVEVCRNIPSEVIPLAQQIHDFMTQPARDVTITIE